jgi:hypothetical protein
MNPEVIEEMIIKFEHLRMQRNEEKQRYRKYMKSLLLKTPVLKRQFLDFHHPSRKDTMGASIA